MMKTRLLLTTVTFGLMTVGVAHAMPAGDSGALFDSLDNNGDNQLSAEELGNLPEVMVRKRFERADIDGNGKISKTEFTVKAKQRAVKLFGRLDSNGDDTLTQDELMMDQDKRHRGDNKDADGMSDENKAESAPDEGTHGHAWMEKLDANDDGSVSRQEWKDGMQRHASKGDGADSNMTDDSDMSDDSSMGNDADMSEDSAMSDDAEMSDGSRMADDADMSDDMEMSDDSKMSNDTN